MSAEGGLTNKIEDLGGRASKDTGEKVKDAFKEP